MSAPDDEIATLRAQVARFTDQAEINALIDRYVLVLDTQDEEGFGDSWPGELFTPDVRMSFPIGTHEGLPGVAEFHLAAKARFDRTLHLSANHLIGLDGDRATVRFHVIASHIHRTDPGTDHPAGAPRFEIGGRYAGEAVRTPEGWRFRQWSFHLVWSDGPGPDGKPLPATGQAAG